MGAIPDLKALQVDVVALLSGVPAGALSVQQQIADLVREALQALETGSLLVPLRSAMEALCRAAHRGPGQGDLLLTVRRRGLVSCPPRSQVPIFAVGSVARSLRRCGRFAEWSAANSQARAHRGEHPFLVEPLIKSGRLFLPPGHPATHRSA